MHPFGPYVRAWYERYRDQGLVVIGVHAPNSPSSAIPPMSARQHDWARLSGRARNKTPIWRAFNNRYWPPHTSPTPGPDPLPHFGEGRTDETEAAIRALLAEKGAKLGGTASVAASGAGAPPTLLVRSRRLTRSRRAEFRSPGGLREGSNDYRIPLPSSSTTGLAGPGRSSRSAPCGSKRAADRLRFRARDLHLVRGSSRESRSVPVCSMARRRRRPGMDIDAAGLGRYDQRSTSLSARRRARRTAVTIDSLIRAPRPTPSLRLAQKIGDRQEQRCPYGNHDRRLPQPCQTVRPSGWRTSGPQS